MCDSYIMKIVRCYMKYIESQCSIFWSVPSLICFLYIGKGKKKTWNIGININGKNQSNIILIAIYSTYSVLSWFYLPNVLYIPLVWNLIGITKHRRFLMRGLWLSFYKHNRSRTIYDSNTETVPYQRKKSVTWLLVELQE